MDFRGLRLVYLMVNRKAWTVNGGRGAVAAPRNAFLIASIALVGGCADLSWHKAGATAEATERDLAECRGEARLGGGPDMRLIRPDAGRAQGLSASQLAPATANRLDGERFLAEHDLTRTCMNRRGYELGPTGKR